LPSNTIATLLCKTEKKLFTNLDATRRLVRYYRGRSGVKNRRAASGGESSGTFFRPLGKCTDGIIPLPEPIQREDAWEVVQLDFDRAICMSDLHIPYHSLEAVEATLKWADKLSPDCIILNGDMADFYNASEFEKDPRRRDLGLEIDACRLFLAHLRQRYKKAQIIYKEGNHEERIWRQAWRQMPELFTVRDADNNRILSLESLFNVNTYGVRVIKDRKPIRAGKHLYVLHGHEFRSPIQRLVNPARGLYLRAKCNAICGHLHQSSSHTQPGLTHIVSCWSTGALCDLHPQYMPINEWNHGFAVIELYRQQWSVTNKKIIKGEVVAA
jgi:predicted phosphodiesterase